jgi:transcriptional regulator with XRE-family HTH domain
MENEIYVIFSTSFQQHRKMANNGRGITQRALASALNVDQSTIAAWERGRNLPTAVMLVKIADALKCSTDALLRG